MRRRAANRPVRWCGPAHAPGTSADRGSSETWRRVIVGRPATAGGRNFRLSGPDDVIAHRAGAAVFARQPARKAWLIHEERHRVGAIRIPVVLLNHDDARPVALEIRQQTIDAVAGIAFLET